MCEIFFLSDNLKFYFHRNKDVGYLNEIDNIKKKKKAIFHEYDNKKK